TRLQGDWSSDVCSPISQPVQGAHPGIAAPRENELARAAHADELIVDQVGRHADQREVATALADDLVAGSKGNQVREPFHGHGVRSEERRVGKEWRCWWA